MLVAYVSGHGYGHSMRTAEVLRAVRAKAPGLPITVCTSAPAFLFEGVVNQPLRFRVVGCDVGLVQKDALTTDQAGTIAALRAFRAGWVELVEREATWLHESGARLVLGDIPPLAFAAASAAGIPSVALGNFSWDWIYGHLALVARSSALARAAAHAAEAYGKAGLLLRLPFAGDTSAFRKVEDVPLVARTPTVDAREARRRLALDDRPVVLVSFGGVGLPGLQPSVLACLDGYQFLLTGRTRDAEGPNLRQLEAGHLASAGLNYADLVGAADVVVSKPGYGIVSDCIGAGTPLVYTERGEFPEYDVLVAEMPRYLPVAHVSNQELREGRLKLALDGVRKLSFPPPPATHGARAAAERLLAAL